MVDPQQTDAIPDRKKRSVSQYHDHIIKRRSAPVTVVNAYTPPSSNITEEEARELCRNAVTESPAFNTCYQLFGESIFNSTASCIDDLQVR